MRTRRALLHGFARRLAPLSGIKALVSWSITRWFQQQPDSCTPGVAVCDWLTLERNILVYYKGYFLLTSFAYAVLDIRSECSWLVQRQLQKLTLRLWKALSCVRSISHSLSFVPSNKLSPVPNIIFLVRDMSCLVRTLSHPVVISLTTFVYIMHVCLVDAASFQSSNSCDAQQVPIRIDRNSISSEEKLHRDFCQQKSVHCFE